MLIMINSDNRMSIKNDNVMIALLSSLDHFHFLDHASPQFPIQLKIEDVFHIQREQPSLSQQLHHVKSKIIVIILTLTFNLYFPYSRTQI